jgi:AcrR family transcriptional regulator
MDSMLGDRSKSARTAEKILMAAHAEFSEHGLAGARVDRIATAAGANKQRIYAYFSSKDNLFAVVLGRAFEALTESAPIPADRGGLADYAGAVFDYHRSEPSLVRLLAWEGLLFRTDALDLSFSRDAYYRTRVAVLAAAVDSSPQKVTEVLLTVVGMASWPFIVPQQRRLLLVGTGVEDGSRMDELRATVAAAGRAVVDCLLPRPGG